jgi:putative RecB family exonuclease
MTTPDVGEQLLLDGMPARLYPAAPSRLATYADCPRRYRMGYLDRPTPPRSGAWAHHSVGAAVHVALARWWELPLARRTPAGGGALVVEAWSSEGFRDERQSREHRDRARGYVERYLATVDPEVLPLGVERTVSVRTGRASLWGRADRIDDRPGEGVVVVDYKTGRAVLTVDDARESLALAVYAAGAARTLRREVTRVELHHLPSGTVVGWEYTAASIETRLADADAQAAAMAALDAAFRAGMTEAEADAAFPPRVAARCGWCEFRSACGPGRSVPPRRPWDGLA